MKSPAIPLLMAVLLATPVLAATPAKVAPKAPAKAAPATKATRSRPVTVESLLTGARAASAKGDSELALRLTQAAIVADPIRPGSYIALGDLYADAGQAEYARAYYDKALEIDPTAPAALKAIAALDGKRPANTAQAGP